MKFALICLLHFVGYSDPYCLIQVGGITLFKSSIKKKTLSPVWEEVAQIPVDWGRTAKVYIIVKDYDALSSDDFLGSLCLAEADLVRHVLLLLLLPQRC